MSLLILLLGLVACGSSLDSNSSPEENGTPDPQNTQSDVDLKEQESKTLTFYYVDEELLTMKEKEATVSYFSEEDMWKAIWSQLQSAEGEGYTSLWEGIGLISIKAGENQLNVNITQPNNIQFGSAAEGFAIQTLIQTLGQIEGFDTIQLLIDGEVHETLAGHVSIDEPIPTDAKIYTGE